MTLFAPIRGIRPDPQRAAEVVELPYDVMSRSEAAEMAAGRPYSFLHVSRPEIDLPGAEFDDPAAYEQAGRAFAGLVDAGLLRRDRADSYYAYRITRGQHQQTGVVGGASVAAYDQGRIRRHELTRPAKQADRARHIRATRAQTGPVFLVHHPDPIVSAVLAKSTALPAETLVPGPGGTLHEIWPINDPELVEQLRDSFELMSALYIADGHHRSAAASMVAAETAGDPRYSGAGQFLAVSFPADEVAILPYNRAVATLGEHSPGQFLTALSGVMDIEPAAAPVAPYHPGEFGVYLAGAWYLADAREIPAQDPVARLDVSVLQDQVLQPLLGIQDPRTDPTIAFIGGVRGVGELERLVDSGGAAVAFSLHPTTIDDLLGVADAGLMMPPKSTWFEPKLLDGLVCNALDA